MNVALYILAFFLTSNIKAQKTEFHIENDFLTPRLSGKPADGEFSSGLKLKVPLKALNPDYRDKVLDYNDGIENLSTFRLTLGQNIFTPRDRESEEPVLDDIPYTGHAYLGIECQEVEPPNLKSKGRVPWMGTTELSLGVRGSAALGEEVQNGVHPLVGSDEVKGWDNQSPNEFAVNLSHQQHFLLDVTLKDRAEIYGNIGGNVGTLSNYLNTGLLLRLNLAGEYSDLADSSFQLIRPSNSTSRPKDYSLSLNAGVELRHVFSNSLIEGSYFHGSDSDLDSEEWVHEFRVGPELRYKNCSLTFQYIHRSEESEDLGSHGFGAITFEINK